MIKLAVHSKRVGPIRGRHPWVFSGALKNIPEGLKSGEAVTLVDEASKFLAHGYFNSYSQIAVRLWSWQEDEVVNEKFFEARVKSAYELRKQFVECRGTKFCAPTDSFRLINAENDLLPGLIVDKYADYLVVQFHTVGIEVWKEQIVAALVKVVKPKGVYERSDIGRAKREDRKRDSSAIVIPSEPATAGDEESLSVNQATEIPRRESPRDDSEGDARLLHGTVPDKIKITENGHKFYVDVKTGQKTGFFLDQRDKRQALTKYVKDKKVLNCFSYTGGFSVYALAAGASHVVSVDASEPALEVAEENVKLNKLDESKAEFILADVKVYLRDLAGESPLEGAPPRAGGGGVRPLSSKSHTPRSREATDPLEGVSGDAPFDVIILDPPAFVKDRHKIREGIQGYRKINEQALRILPPGGILVTCSCSAHVSLMDFRYMLTEAAGRVGRTVQIIETYTHGIDHPELVAYTEGEYLKCLIARVL